MAAIKVVYTLLLIFIVGFLFFGQSPETKDGRIFHSIRKSGPRVKLHKPTAKVNPKLDHISFDPKVAEYEQKYDDKVWEREYFRHHKEEMERARRLQEHEVLDETLMANQEESAERAEHHGFHQEDFEDYSGTDDFAEEDEDYFETDRFNITARLSSLFPSIDQSPADGFISLEELTKWHVEQAKKTSMHRTSREMEVTDKDGDGFVTLKEYLHDESPGNEINLASPRGDEHWVKQAEEQFPLADKDGDGKLNEEEFNDFLHPEDSENPKLRHSLLKDEIRTRDTDKDGKLSFMEFYENLYSELREFGEEDPVDTAVRSHVGKDPQDSRPHLSDAMETKMSQARAKFDELDKDKDGFLTEAELEVVLDKLQPGEKFYAQQQAGHMVEQADNNHDGKLTLAEMIEHPYVFYNVVHHEDEDEEGMHDEFR